VRLPSDNRVGTIGPPLPDTQIEIRDPEGRKLGPGQVGIVWIRGPQVMRGYYKNPDRTERVLRDGWFDSGDLGLVEPDGHVRITGRAKDTIVLAGGENVEPEPLELQLKTSPLIQQAVVLGQDRKTLGALFVPDLELLEERIPRSEWNCENGVIHGPAVTKALRREIDGIMTVDNGFRGFERIAKFRVLEEPLTPENGLLTATLKVKRHVVAERFAKLIEDMYAQ
jgi:long-chain acyl-CoA synthetase